jgi:hypothetical protein
MLSERTERRIIIILMVVMLVSFMLFFGRRQRWRMFLPAEPYYSAVAAVKG